MATVIQIKGLKEMAHAFHELPLNVMKRQLRRGPAKAAKLIAEDAAMRAPVDTGRLTKAVIIKRITGEPNEQATYIVMPRHGKSQQHVKMGKTRTQNLDAYYWTFIEFGTSKMAAQPFLRPAFETLKGHALDVILNELATGIDYEATLLKWSTP